MVKALVIGGSGFLGRAIVQRLLARGDAVRSFSRRVHPDLQRPGIEVVRGDVRDAEAVAAACAGREIVFHVAAKAGIWGRRADYYETNVRGTQNVIAACRQQGVPRLVFTSSPSVVFDGTDMAGIDESVPYARHYQAHYPATKAAAERMVLAANGDRLATVALRPHLIWGPGDTQLVPRIIARRRWLRRIGDLDKPVDSTYIDNAAEAHVLAGDRLGLDSAAAGRAYFISQGEPRGVWDLINGILAAAGRPPIERRMRPVTALAAGAVFEALYGLLGLRREPPLTRFLARQLSTAHWFDIAAARRDLGYEPRVSIDEGLRRLAEWLRSRGEEQRAD